MTLADQESPRLFISYSWSSPEHEDWVVSLASQLVESGVNVVLDKWDLKEGHDAYSFMEKMVTDSDIKKVVIISDRIYSEKSDKRVGGVGTEAQIISPEIYTKQDQSKFVVIVSERDEKGNPYLPTYYQTRMYIDLSDRDMFSTNFEQLLRWVYDKPLYVKPKLGVKPSFLADKNLVSLGTTTSFKRALDAVRYHKSYAKGALDEFFSVFAKNIEELRICQEDDGEFDEKVVHSIEQSLPHRNEVIEIFLAVAQYRNTQETVQQLQRFLESLISYIDRPTGVTQYREWDCDNFKFIVHELFLYGVAALLKYECFDSVAKLLRNGYFVRQHSGYGQNTMVPFTVFRSHIRSLKYRSDRLELRRLSLHADILNQRCKSSGLDFDDLMQADFVLYIRDALLANKKGCHPEWWPETLLYADRYSGAFEMFARSESAIYFDKMKSIFDVEKVNEIAQIVDELDPPRWEFQTFRPQELLGIDQLATKP